MVYLLTAANAHLIVIWGEDASSPMHLLHMGYGLGTVLSPLIVSRLRFL